MSLSLLILSGAELQNSELSYLQSFRTVEISHFFQPFALWDFANFWSRQIMSITQLILGRES